ncbi:MAG: hydrolase [Alphaproteobacteria bacterium]
MLIDLEKSCLLVVDIQGKLLSVMEASGRVTANTAILLKAAARLGIPVLASEQYPKGLGPTADALGPLIPEGAVLEKTHFSCADVPEYRDRLGELGREQAVITGIEAHVCVLQTALGLKRQGYECFVVSDAVSSRTRENHAAAMDRLRGDGVGVVTTEMVLFEWLGRAGTPEFKELSALIK